MSSLERPSTPQPPDLSGGGGLRDDAERPSETVASYVLKEGRLSADDEFVGAHLRKCPERLMKALNTQTNRNLVAEIQGAKSEHGQYRPASSLLTILSDRIWKDVKSRSRDNLKRLHLDRYDSAMQFVDHHSSAPTHYPFPDVQDKPDLVGVFPPPGNPNHVWDVAPSSDANIGIPHYRLEALVEVKNAGSDAPSQVRDYAFQHLRARPDHPGVYCLSIRSQGFTILYADTTGCYMSEEFSWDDLEILAAFIYSIYDPPAKHILRDSTIQWAPSVSTDPCSAPVWRIQINNEEYCHGKMIFGGDPWSRRTTVFECSWPSQKFLVIMKDYYRQLIRRYDEGDLVRDIHADGFVPGIVRFAASENVEYEGEPIVVGEGDEARIRRRHLMLDHGEELLKAKSVNDLLKAIYDVLEVDRVLAMERKILHRDMSIYNVLMYPKWGKFAHPRFIEPRPPLIDDILAGQLRDPEDYEANCVLIDFDNGAKIELGNKPYELACRTGTPTYISRAVSIGRIWLADHMVFHPMPSLTEEARALYEALHGKERYERFEDKDGKCHGGVPPRAPVEKVPDEFYHKLEYDAESIWWTTLTACLRVKPVGEVDIPEVADALSERWKVLQEHVIKKAVKKNILDYRERAFLDCTLNFFLDPFSPSMQDLGKMLYELGRHVFPSYPLMETQPPYPDHLHEAMQRIILNYLVAHRNDDILLDPDNLRSTKGSEEPKPQQQTATAGSGTGSSNPKKRTRDAEPAVPRKSMRLSEANLKQHSLPVQALTGYPYQFNPRP